MTIVKRETPNAVELDLEKIEVIHSFQTISKHGGGTLVTCRYLGNDEYQFVASPKQMTVLKETHFDPEDADSVHAYHNPDAKPKKKAASEPKRKSNR